MKVDILHYAAPPVVGGVESVIGHHSQMMRNAGQEVRILAGRGAQMTEGIGFIHIPLADSRHPDILDVKKDLDRGMIPPKFHNLVDRLEETLESILKGTDILIAHNVCSLNKNLALTTALKRLHDRRVPPKLILWHHDLAWCTPRYLPELHEGYPWDLLRGNWPDAVQVVVSRTRQLELAEISGIPAEQIHTVPNGLDIVQFFKFEHLTARLMDELHFLETRPLLLQPVRITPRKNLELGLRILESLRQTLPDARLVVTGPLGPHNPANAKYFKHIRDLRSELGLEQAAVFLAEIHPGFLPDAVIADFYRLADALLFTSREEGFGIPILEAGLAGIPAFCARIPPLEELGRQDVEYFSLEENPAEIARRIQLKLTESQQYRLRSRVVGSFTWESIYREHIAPILDG